MFICPNAEVVHGQRKVANPCSILFPKNACAFARDPALLPFFMFFMQSTETIKVWGSTQNR